MSCTAFRDNAVEEQAAKGGQVFLSIEMLQHVATRSPPHRRKLQFEPHNALYSCDEIVERSGAVEEAGSPVYHQFRDSGDRRS